MKHLSACIKHAPRIPPGFGGVYAWCWPGGGVYVGQTARSDFATRWREHLDGLRLGYHHNDGMRAAWKAYGDAAPIVLGVYPRRHLTAWERWWMTELRRRGWRVSNEVL